MLKRCLALSREIGSKELETSALTALGKLEAGLGNFDAAEQNLQAALAIADSSGDLNNIAGVLIGLGSLFNKRGEPDRSLALLERAVEISGETHSRHHEQEAHQLLAQALEAKKNFNTALSHWKLASSIKEELLGAEKQKALTDLQIRSNIEKSETEKEILKKEMEVKSREIERMGQEIKRMSVTLADKTEQTRSISRRIQEILQPWDESIVGDARTEYEKLISELEHDHTAQGEETMFNNEFQLIHRTILQKLSKNYPALTFTERKVCVLLREGLTTKQMAAMLRTSTRTIETHRYEIRKKMKLGPGANLNTALAGLTTE
jgi:tetratricopeptide (TPR) repeat protein